METNTANPTAKQLAEIVGATKDPESLGLVEVDATTVNVGDVAWTYSRGTVRRGLVVKVGTKNARVEYVTAGGLKQGAELMARYRATNFDKLAAEAAAIASRNFNYFEREGKNPEIVELGHDDYVAREVTRRTEERRAIMRQGIESHVTISGKANPTVWVEADTAPEADEVEVEAPVGAVAAPVADEPLFSIEQVLAGARRKFDAALVAHEANPTDDSLGRMLRAGEFLSQLRAASGCIVLVGENGEAVLGGR